MKKNVKFLLAVSSVVAGLFISSCSLNNDNVQPTPTAALMAFNLAPDKSGIGVTLSGNLLPGPLAYTSFTGGYISIYPGTREVRTYDYLTGNTLTINSGNFTVNKFYSSFLVGNNKAYKNVVVRDNFDSLSVVTGKAYIRYINAIADSTQSPEVTINAGGTDVVKKNAAYASVSNFVPVSIGDVNVKVSNSGSINATRKITLTQSKIYTVLLVGVPSSTDTTKSVKIKYIENGIVDNKNARVAASANAIN